LPVTGYRVVDLYALDPALGDQLRRKLAHLRVTVEW
jgi:hypothetical protein